MRSIVIQHKKAVIALLCLVITGACIFFSRFLIVPGGVYSRDASYLDLRQQTVMPQQYERLRKKLPDAVILWNVPIGNNRYDCESVILHVGDFPEKDLANFAYFENLRQVNAVRSESYEALLALYEAYPELDIRWAVELADKKFSQGCEILRLKTEEATVAELLEKLAWLPELKTLVLDGTVSPEDQAALMERYPDVMFDWDVSLCGITFRSTDKTLSFAGKVMTEKDLDTIRDNLFRFYTPEVIDLTDCGMSDQQLIKFREKTGVEIGWDFELCGVTVNSLDVEVDLSGHVIENVSEVEASLPYFSRLEKVIMSHCGIPDQEMDALNRRYENIRFVWTVKVGGYELRTDITNFIATKEPKGYIHDRHTEPLKYCTDLEGLDLGHNFITDISFVRYMPHMKYFIVAENPVVDLSPLVGLQELVYLEIFLTNVTDFTPLLSLTTLDDLNLCHIYTVSGDHAFEVLSQMTWLERLWYSGHAMNRTQEQALAEALPNCELMLKRGQESVCGNWRYGRHYYDMRDLFGMYYMNEWGDRVEGRQDPPYR